jgi:hypothetical protein
VDRLARLHLAPCQSVKIKFKFTRLCFCMVGLLNRTASWSCKTKTHWLFRNNVCRPYIQKCLHFTLSYGVPAWFGLHGAPFVHATRTFSDNMVRRQFLHTIKKLERCVGVISYFAFNVDRQTVRQRTTLLQKRSDLRSMSLQGYTCLTRCYQ